MTDYVQRTGAWWIVGGVGCLAALGLDAHPFGARLDMLAGVLCLVGICVARFEHVLLFVVAISIIHGDVAVIAAQAILVVRLALRGELALDSSLPSLLLCATAVSAIGSALFGFLAIEQRPVQWMIWIATTGLPLVALCLARTRIGDLAIERLSRFLVFCLLVQIPVGFADLQRWGEFVPGDWFAGTWQDANMVGLWSASFLGVCVVRLVVLPSRAVGVPGVGSTIVGLGAAAFLVTFASARIFAGSVFGATGLVIAGLWLAGRGLSRTRLAMRAGLVVIVSLAAGLVAHAWFAENTGAFASNWQESGKQVLFARVFAQFDDRYNAVLGAGPGMLGSRAANAASGDILFKEVAGLGASLLGPAPEPERWALRDLWTAELAETIATKSALITMPFSGWATVRGELGWPAVISLFVLLPTLAIQLATTGVRHPPIFAFAVAAAIVCAGLPIMLIFDNMLEQPHVIAPLIVLAMVARGYRPSVVPDQRIVESDN